MMTLKQNHAVSSRILNMWPHAESVISLNTAHAAQQGDGEGGKEQEYDLLSLSLKVFSVCL